MGVLSRIPEEIRKELGVAAFERQALKEIVSGIRGTQLVLSGGGGLFQDATSLKSLAYYLRIPVLAKLMGKKTMVFAQGIGPIRNPLGKLLTRWTCNWFVDRITVRDEGSRDLLVALGVKREIEVTADLTLLLPDPDQEKLLEAARRYKLEGTFLGVVLRHRPGIEDRLPSMARSVSDFCRANGLTPLLLPFQPGQDETMARTLAERLEMPSLDIPATLPPQELLAIFANLALVVGMRYHALLFSAKSLVPFVAIGTDPKITGFATHLGFPLLLPEELSSDKLNEALSTAWQTRHALREHLKREIPRLTKKASRNIESALKLLESPGAKRRGF